MDCQRIDTILDEHRTGALSATERSQIDAHLETCQRCADVWLSHEVLSAEPPEAPRQGLFDEIAANVIDRPQPMTASRAAAHWRSLFAVAASVAVVVVITGVMVLGESETDEQDGVEVATTESVRPTGLEILATPPATVVGDFIAGRDYERVRNPELLANTDADNDSDSIVVCEFFMFECVFCFNFEPSFVEWEETQSDDVVVERVPALFNGLARLHAQAFYAAKLLGASEGLHMAFYEAIHVRGNPLSSVADIREFFVRNGVAGADFDRAFESGAVMADLQRAEELNRLYGVTATPSIGVNGKYLTNPGLTGSNERMFEVVDALIHQEAADRCSSGDSDWCPIE